MLDRRRLQPIVVRFKRLARRSRILASCVLAVILLGSILGVAWFSHFMTAPAQGVIVPASQLYPAAASFDMTPAHVDSAYASFNYPKGMVGMLAQAPKLPFLVNYKWQHHDIETWRLSVAVIDVPSGAINDNNAYLFRKQNPTRFIESSEIVRGEVVPVMTDATASGFSKMCFLRYGRYQAIISLYGDDARGPEPLQKTLAMVLESWHWRQG